MFTWGGCAADLLKLIHAQKILCVLQLQQSEFDFKKSHLHAAEFFFA